MPGADEKTGTGEVTETGATQEEKVVPAGTKPGDDKTTEPQQTGSETTTEEEAGAEEGAVEVDIKSIVKDDEGNFVWRLDPSNPKSMVYKGATLDELFQNVAKNITDKDSYITRLKSKQTLDPSAFKNRRVVQGESGPVAQEEVVYPDYGKILRETFADAGVDVKFLNLTRDQWKEMEEQQGTLEALELRQKIKELQSTARSVYEERNVVAVNDHSLLEETESVTDMLLEAGLTTSEFDYDEVLEAVHSNPNNFLKNGMRKNGRIVAEAAKVIRKLTAEKAETTATRKTVEKIAENRIKKADTTGGVQGKPGPTTPIKPNVPKTTAEAVADIKKQYGVKD